MFRTNVVLNYTEIEAKVREATNDEAWGPTGKMILNYALYQQVLFYWTYVLNILVYFHIFLWNVKIGVSDFQEFKLLLSLNYLYLSLR